MISEEVSNIQSRVMWPEVGFAIMSSPKRRSAATENNTGATHKCGIVKPVRPSRTHDWDLSWSSVTFREVMPTLKTYEGAERFNFPIFRNHPRLGLLVTSRN